MRVIVIGSGIAGLSTAIACRAVGLDVALYERAPELREVGAGISLWANALRALDHIGAGDAVRRVSLHMTRFEMRVRDGRTVAMSFPASVFEQRFRLAPFVCMTHRADLVAALAGCLPDGVCRYGHEFESLQEEYSGRQVGVGFRNGHFDKADLVVGADGIHSRVREVLFFPQPPRYAGYTCWRGVCPRPAKVAAGYMAEWWGRGRRFGITTIPGDRVYWFATLNAPPNGREPDERAFLASAFAGWADPVPELIAATPPDRVLRNDIIDRPPTKAWSRGRAVLVGDAAHPTTPNLGQGGCQAIEDAVVLARHLAANATDPVKAAEDFTRERSPRTTRVVNESWKFGRIGQCQNRLACWLRDTAVGLLMPLLGSGGLVKHATFDVGPLPAATPTPKTP
jgi:2-polyprenyl-6-methoxyphenol hydroxylase-like FAD-dependent oxidoreductase